MAVLFLLLVDVSENSLLLEQCNMPKMIILLILDLRIGNLMSNRC